MSLERDQLIANQGFTIGVGQMLGSIAGRIVLKSYLHAPFIRFELERNITIQRHYIYDIEDHRRAYLLAQLDNWPLSNETRMISG